MSMLTKIRMKCHECPIRHSAVCASCDEDELALLEKIKTYRQYEAGDIILWRGDTLDYVASVVSGVATLGKTLSDGRTQMLGLLLPSDFMGRLGRQHIEFDVTAATDIVLCCFERKKFEQLVLTSPQLSRRLLQMALDELDSAREWMILLGRKTAREKIATFLHMLLKRRQITPADVEVKLPLPINREQIADYLGLTLETVSRQMTRLKSDGLIDIIDRKTLLVPSPELLKNASGDEDE